MHPPDQRKYTREAPRMSAQEESLRKSQYTTNADALDPFPAGIPRPDHARNWGRKTESVLAARRLTDIVQGKITPGIFPPIVGRPPKTEKATVDPKKGVFCTGCPHKNRQGEILKCACDPREELHGGMKVLRLMAWTDPDLAKLTETRAQFAKLLGITAKPLPKIEKPLQPFGRGNGGGRGGRGGGRGGRGSPQNAADVEEIIELSTATTLQLVDLCYPGIVPLFCPG